MRDPVTFVIENIRGRQIYKNIRSKGSEYYETRLNQYGGKEILDTEKTNQYIIDHIQS